eukprot:m.991 g.991  ORF g.991 m.991 type:complete len:249 (+) comp5413_c0_seq1:483-1229(+)
MRYCIMLTFLHTVCVIVGLHLVKASAVHNAATLLPNKTNVACYPLACQRASVVLLSQNRSEALHWNSTSSDVHLHPTSALSQNSVFYQRSAGTDKVTFQTSDEQKYLAVDGNGRLYLDDKSSTEFFHYMPKPSSYAHENGRKIRVFTYTLFAKRSFEGSTLCFMIRPGRQSLLLKNAALCKKSAKEFHDKLTACTSLAKTISDEANWFQKDVLVKRRGPKKMCPRLNDHAAKCCDCSNTSTAVQATRN